MSSSSSSSSMLTPASDPVERERQRAEVNARIAAKVAELEAARQALNTNAASSSQAKRSSTDSPTPPTSPPAFKRSKVETAVQPIASKRNKHTKTLLPVVEVPTAQGSSNTSSSQDDSSKRAHHESPLLEQLDQLHSATSSSSAKRKPDSPDPTTSKRSKPSVPIVEGQGDKRLSYAQALGQHAAEPAQLIIPPGMVKVRDKARVDVGSTRSAAAVAAAAAMRQTRQQEQSRRRPTLLPQPPATSHSTASHNINHTPARAAPRATLDVPKGMEKVSPRAAGSSSNIDGPATSAARARASHEASTQAVARGRSDTDKQPQQSLYAVPPTKSAPRDALVPLATKAAEQPKTTARKARVDGDAGRSTESTTRDKLHIPSGMRKVPQAYAAASPYVAPPVHGAATVGTSSESDDDLPLALTTLAKANASAARDAASNDARRQATREARAQLLQDNLDNPRSWVQRLDAKNSSSAAASSPPLPILAQRVREQGNGNDSAAAIASSSHLSDSEDDFPLSLFPPKAAAETGKAAAKGKPSMPPLAKGVRSVLASGAGMASSSSQASSDNKDAAAAAALRKAEKQRAELVNKIERRKVQHSLNMKQLAGNLGDAQRQYEYDAARMQKGEISFHEALKNLSLMHNLPVFPKDTWLRECATTREVLPALHFDPAVDLKQWEEHGLARRCGSSSAKPKGRSSHARFYIKRVVRPNGVTQLCQTHAREAPFSSHAPFWQDGEIDAFNIPRALIYGGVTANGAPEIRVGQDIRLARSEECGNSVLLHGLGQGWEMECFELPELAVPLRTPATAAASATRINDDEAEAQTLLLVNNDAIAPTEQVLHLLGGTLFNVSEARFGGLETGAWSAPQDVVDSRVAVREVASRAAVLVEEDADARAKLRAALSVLYASAANAHRQREPKALVASPVAMAEAAANATISALDTTYPVLLISLEPSQSALKGTSFWRREPQAAAAQLFARLCREVGIGEMPLIDFFPVFARNDDFRDAAVTTLRTAVQLIMDYVDARGTSPIIVTMSAPASAAVTNGWLGASRPETLARKDLTQKDSWQTAGNMDVVDIMGKDVVRVQMPHVGSTAYQPTARALFITVYTATLQKAQLAQTIARTHPNIHPTDLLQLIDQEAVEIGIASALARAKDELQLFSPARSMRSLSSQQRRSPEKDAKWRKSLSDAGKKSGGAGAAVVIPALGEAGSEERRQQAEALLEASFLPDSVVPAPRDTPIGSQEWYDWIMRLEKGKSLPQSAAASHRIYPKNKDGYSMPLYYRRAWGEPWSDERKTQLDKWRELQKRGVRVPRQVPNKQAWTDSKYPVLAEPFEAPWIAFFLDYEPTAKSQDRDMIRMANSCVSNFRNKLARQGK